MSRLHQGLLTCACLLSLGNNLARAQSLPLTISFWYPTNGQTFLAPATIGVHALVTDSNVVETVRYFAGGTNIGIVTNTGGVLLTNTQAGNPFFMAWSNVPAGSYTLTAVATDSAGHTATSAPVNIYVTNAPPHIVPFVVSFWYPSNGQTFLAPANIGVHARVTDSNLVETVEYFAGTTNIGLVTNNGTAYPFFLAWSNVPAGDYTLTAVSTDSAGHTATSAPVNIYVTNAPPRIVPFVVSFWYPTNGQTFLAPATIGVHALVTDSNVVETVQYFAGGTNIGIVTNTGGVLLTNTHTDNPFFLAWSNVPAGDYTLTAVSTDSAGHTATSAPVNIYVTNAPPHIVPFFVGFWYPTNGQAFLAPATIGVHALVTDSNVVETVQYFAGGTNIGIVTNTGGVLLTNTHTDNPFFLAWSNVPAGSYTLTAVATDSAGHTATSAPVNIYVTNAPPHVVPFVVSFWYPSNGQTFLAPANIGVHARVTDSNLVETVEYFSGTTNIGLVTNNGTAYPFFLAWSNVPAGDYTLTAVATDSAGHTATSAPVNIYVTNAPPHIVPFEVSFWYPTNGQTFLAPANIGVHARVTDSNFVETVEYFSGTTNIGLVTNNGTAYPFFLAWSNVPAGDYTLTAVATDSAGHTATSAPVNIYVLTNLPPEVSIYAPDPVAVEGTNTNYWFQPPNTPTNYSTGSNTATFLVRRDSATNVDLTVYFSIGGTASNGVDYAAIPNYVTMPAGQRYALIAIVPLDDVDHVPTLYDTVVLALTVPTNNPPPYSLGLPAAAGAIILEENLLPMVRPTIRHLSDHSIHVSLPATNGMNFALQISSDLVNWRPVCTNTVLKGSAQFVDPKGGDNPLLFYRVVPAAPPTY